MGSWIWAVLLTIVAVIGGVMATQSDKAMSLQRADYSQSVAGNMMVYRNAVTAYAKSHKTVQGKVADSNLNLPVWFRRAANVSNYVKDGLGYVYYTAQNEGQAYDMLKNAKNDVNVGISRGGFLFNPIAGKTLTALPPQVPEGAVVFAPAALNAAGPPPPPPGSLCHIPAGTSRTWSVGGNSCTGAQAAERTLSHLSVLGFTDSAPGTAGLASFQCVNGNLAVSPQPGATCAPAPPRDCVVPRFTARDWNVGGVACAGETLSDYVIKHGWSLNIVSFNGNTGAAGFLCTDGVIASTHDGSATCTAPAIACSLPSPQQESEIETRTVSQDLPCPAGYLGGPIVQTRQEQRPRSRYSYCPAPTGPYAWSPWNYSGWSATTGWTTTSNTCVAPTCAGSSTQTQWVNSSEACPSGYVGSITWEAQQSSSRTCNLGTWSAWSPWTYAGNERNRVNTCTPATCTGSSSQSWWLPSSAACPSGYIGSNTWEAEQVSTRTCSFGTWSAWGPWTYQGTYRNHVNTCVLATCSGPTSQTQWVASSTTCPAGYTGSNTWEREQVQTRTCNMGTWSGWSAWSNTGNTRNAVNSCVEATCAGPAAQTQWLASSAACPAGQIGTRTWEREQVQSRSCSFGSWSGWGTWVDTGNIRGYSSTCYTPTCSGPSSETQWVNMSAGCPAGQTGAQTWQKEQAHSRTCNAGTWSGWGSWVDTGATRSYSNTCTTPAPTLDYGCEFGGPYGNNGFESGGCYWDPTVGYSQSYAVIFVGDTKDAQGRPVLNTSLYRAEMTPAYPGGYGATCSTYACGVDPYVSDRFFTRIRVFRISNNALLLDVIVETDFSNL